MTTSNSKDGTPGAAPGRWMARAGWVLTALTTLALAASAIGKLTRATQVVEMMAGKFGFPPGALVPIGMLELACALLYANPRTSVLGAMLVTGYLGGAVATHVRAGDPFAAPIVLGVIAWGGLFLRDERIRALVPWRKPSSR
jgi:hypothetical protein